MYVFNHAQPALLYLVPGTLIPSTLTAFFSGEFKELWDYDEEKIQKEEMEKLNKNNKKEDKKKSEEKEDDNEKKRVIEKDDDDDEKERIKEKND